jgi:hypothetical protein
MSAARKEVKCGVGISLYNVSKKKKEVYIKMTTIERKQFFYGDVPHDYEH